MTYTNTKQHKFYKIYEGLGAERSLNKVYEKCNNEISLIQLKRYSSKYNWVEKAKQHDLEQIKLEDTIERQRFKEFIKEQKKELEQDFIMIQDIRKRLEKDLLNPEVKGTTICNSFYNYVLSYMELLKIAHRLYGQAWNIDPLVVNFVKQNNQMNILNNK